MCPQSLDHYDGPHTAGRPSAGAARGASRSGGERQARLALGASPSAEPIPWTLRILAGAPAPVSMQTVTRRPAGSAGHLLMRESSGVPGPRVGGSPVRCAARRCQVESQAACPAGWGPGPWQERGKLAGAAAPGGCLCQRQHSVCPGNAGRGPAGGTAPGVPQRARELGLPLAPPPLLPGWVCQPPAGGGGGSAPGRETG